MRTLDVSGYTGFISVVAEYDVDGAVVGLEILEADPKIKVTAGMMVVLLGAGAPWATFDGALLRLRDGDQTVIYRLDGIDRVSGTGYFSWVD